MHAFLNFQDLQDGTFFCREYYKPIEAGYTPDSAAHQMVRVLFNFIQQSRESAPDEYFLPSGLVLPENAELPVLETEAHIQLSDEGQGFRAHVTYQPHLDVTSPSHLACGAAVLYLKNLCEARTNALVTVKGEDRPRVLQKEVMNGGMDASH